MEENFFYAQIDDNNVVFCVSSLSGEVNSPKMLRLENEDTNLLGMVWNPKLKKFEENPNKVVETNISVANFRSRFTMDEMRSLYESSDVMVKILLDDLRTRMFIDLSDSNIIELIDNLVSLGIITSERKSEIISL